MYVFSKVDVSKSRTHLIIIHPSVVCVHMTVRQLVPNILIQSLSRIILGYELLFWKNQLQKLSTFYYYREMRICMSANLPSRAFSKQLEHE